MTYPHFVFIMSLNKIFSKDIDEDSRIYLKITASRGGCKSGMSKIFLNITSELQNLKHKGVGSDGIPPLQEHIWKTTRSEYVVTGGYKRSAGFRPITGRELFFI